MRTNTTETWWTQTSVQAGDTVAGTTSETLFASKPSIIPANSLAVGDAIRIRAMGLLSTGLTAATFLFRHRAGNTNLVTNSGGLTVGISLTNKPWWLCADFDVRAIGASGSIMCSGNANISTGLGLTVQDVMGGAAITVDTTADIQLQLSVQMSSLISGNTITLQQYVAEFLRA